MVLLGTVHFCASAKAAVGIRKGDNDSRAERPFLPSEASLVLRCVCGLGPVSKRK